MCLERAIPLVHEQCALHPAGKQHEPPREVQYAILDERRQRDRAREQQPASASARGPRELLVRGRSNALARAHALVHALHERVEVSGHTGHEREQQRY